MLTWIGRSVLLIGVIAQGPTLEQERQLAYGRGSIQGLVTVIARHVDGSPLRGYIRCAGEWQKYQDRRKTDPIEFVTELPFRTDARGAVVMNPNVEDAWLYCYAEDNGMHGSVTAYFNEDDPLEVVELVLNNKGAKQ